MGNSRTQGNRSNDTEIGDYIQRLISVRYCRRMLRKERGNGLVSVEDYVKVSTHGLKKYIKKIEESLIRTANNGDSNIRTLRETTEIKDRKEKWEEKKWMGILSDNLSRLHKRRPEHVWYIYIYIEQHTPLRKSVFKQNSVGNPIFWLLFFFGRSSLSYHYSLSHPLRLEA